MKAASIRGLLIAVVISIFAAPSYGQEATFTGTATDSTGSVLPGVTITAVHTASGNVFTTVTNERGEYRLPVRVGEYTIKAELSGFGTVMRATQVLIGQTAAIDMRMSPQTVQESVTVTAEAPLVDTKGSTVGANIDPRQVEQLPINGRNWMDLTLLAPGARRNEGGGMAQFRQGYSQTNVDGQQITINYHSQTDSEQPSFSKDAIAEFEVVANRFDATQGRSQGMIVNAITRSGTNQFAGSFGGYFRDDKFNAKDFLTHTVLPYSNQQTSATFGGPIVRDRLWFFAAGRRANLTSSKTFAQTGAPYSQQDDGWRGEGKLTGRLGEGHSVQFGFLNNSRTLENTPSFQSFSIDPFTLTTQKPVTPAHKGGTGRFGRAARDAGSFLAAAGAGPVYKLFGKKDVGATEFPPIDTALISGDIGFRQHTGGHTDGPTWPTFLTFADKFIKVKK